MKMYKLNIQHIYINPMAHLSNGFT